MSISSTAMHTATHAALLDALRRLDRLLANAVARFDARRGAAHPDPYRGLYIGQEEVARLLAGNHDDALGEDAVALVALDAAESRLARLAGAFGLAQLEADLLLLALAPALDRRYERLYGYLQDDMTRRRPTVDFALGLLRPSFAERLAARGCLAPSAPLLRHALIRLLDDPQDNAPPLLLKELKIEDRIVEYVLGSDALDVQLAAFARLVMPQQRLDDLVLPAPLKHRLTALANSGSVGWAISLHGPDGAGKQTVAEAMCRAAGKSVLLAVDASRIPGDSAGFEATLRRLRRDARLLGASMLWNNLDALLTDERHVQREVLLRELAGDTPLFLAGSESWQPSDLPDDMLFLQIDLPRPTAAERVQLWARALAAGRRMTDDGRWTDDERPKTEGAWSPAHRITSAELAELANAFRLTPGQIRDAAAMARSLAHWRDPEHGQVILDDLNAACRMQSSPRLATLARKIVPHYRWDDLVLPPERKQQLREICEHMRHRARVHDEWGFGRKLALGKGLAALFAGPSGTGKTMAADIIAGELGLDLYKIDLATVVSKYIGETEKNLARIFEEAERSNAILFFDEADALFGKRSEVKDAHDRYANLEVAYLLQRVEEYEGITILASNLRKNMDDAFVRRMQFIVEFPFPGERERRRIWEQVWPAATPRDPALDLHFMARRCEIAGGNIRNVALHAAFLAAPNGGVVTMEHLIQATRREYQKIGKVVGEGEFGEYGSLLNRSF